MNANNHGKNPEEEKNKTLKEKIEEAGGFWIWINRPLLGVYLLVLPLVLTLFIIDLWPVKEFKEGMNLPTQGERTDVKPEAKQPPQDDAKDVEPGQTPTPQDGAEDVVSGQTPTPQDGAEDVVSGQTPTPSDKESWKWVDKTMISKKNIPFYLRMLILVLLAGALGSYIHTATAFSYHIAWGSFEYSWCWWYWMRIPTGAALALVFLMLIEGNIFVAQNNSTDVNPVGILGLAAMVGLFSRYAIDKLEDIFEVVFSKKKEEKTETAEKKIVEKMKKEGVSIADISKYTGLKEEDIKKL